MPRAAAGSVEFATERSAASTRGRVGVAAAQDLPRCRATLLDGDEPHLPSLEFKAGCAARVPQAAPAQPRELGCDCGNADNQRDARDTRTVRGELLLTNRRDVLADASLVPRDRTTSGVVSLVIRIDRKSTRLNSSH